MNRMVTYEDWYDIKGHKLESEILQWYCSCPSPWIDEHLPPLEDVLFDEYSSYCSDIEDYEYERYKDSLLDL